MTLTKIEKQLLQDFRAMAEVRQRMVSVFASKLATNKSPQAVGGPEKACIPVCVKP